MEECEEPTPAKNGGGETHKDEVSRRLTRTNQRLREVRARLRMGRPPETRTSEQREVVARVAAALDIYTDYFYPSEPR
jgi:hypothetical protein